MSRLIDLTGQRFGRLTVLRRIKSTTKHARWHCRCDCENEVNVYSNNLIRRRKRKFPHSCGCVNITNAGQFGRWTVLKPTKNQSRSICRCRCKCGTIKLIRKQVLKTGESRSCGCATREAQSHGHATGGTITPEYVAFRNAKRRCTDPNDKSYHNYGARGVEFLFTSFEDFFNHLGKRLSAKHSIGRYLDSGNYEAGNCCWQTKAEQIAEHYGKVAMLRLRASRLEVAA